MQSASKLWDLLHEVAAKLDPESDLYSRVQDALDEGIEELGMAFRYWQVDEWDGIQVKHRTIKTRCTQDQAERLRQQYEFAGRQVRVLQVTRFELELKKQ